MINLKPFFLRVKQTWAPIQKLRAKLRGLNFRTPSLGGSRVPPFTRIRIWDSETLKIHSHWFWRPKIFVGSDGGCDLRLEKLSRSAYCLDVKAQEIWNSETNETTPVEPGAIFRAGLYCLQWKSLTFFSPARRWTISLMALGFIILGTAGWSGRLGRMRDCNYVERLIRDGQFEKLSTMTFADKEKTGFANMAESMGDLKRALRKDDLVSTRASIKGIVDVYHQLGLPKDPPDHCQLMKPIYKAELKILDHWIVDWAKDNQPLKLADEIDRLKNRYSGIPVRELDQRISTLARRLYYDGYRIEEDDPARGQELMDQSSELCARLGESAQCFKSRKNLALIK